MTTRIFFLTPLGIIPKEKPFTSFLSFFCFTIVPDDRNTSILIPLANPYMSLPFSNNWGFLLLNVNIPDACLVRFINWDLSLFYF